MAAGARIWIQSTKFERWLTLSTVGRIRFWINGKLEAQTPATSSVRDAMKQIDGYAVFNDEVRQPAILVGGNEEVIWIDLGKDGRAVRVTASGWDIVSGADVAFIRSDAMLPLPKPVPGGSLEALKRVLNVATEDFPLPVGWLLQTWNPIGPYPLIDISGKSGVGKTLTLEMLLRVTDPNSAGVRKPPSKIQDVFIAAKNNWLIGYDNMSAMPKNLSDAFCQLATGITDATRSHYTNDEEHVITVERPFIVSGIAQHLTERADLASRAVKLYFLRFVSALAGFPCGNTLQRSMGRYWESSSMGWLARYAMRRALGSRIQQGYRVRAVRRSRMSRNGLPRGGIRQGLRSESAGFNVDLVRG